MSPLNLLWMSDRTLELVNPLEWKVAYLGESWSRKGEFPAGLSDSRWGDVLSREEAEIAVARQRITELVKSLRMRQVTQRLGALESLGRELAKLQQS